jgi:hypothetical protein
MKNTTVPELSVSIEKLLNEFNWNPHDIGNESIINLIEVKAMFIYAQKKLNKIMKREGYADTK